MIFEGVELPARPVAYDRSRQHAIIDVSELPTWQADDFQVCGSETINESGTIVYRYRVVKIAPKPRRRYYKED